MPDKFKTVNALNTVLSSGNKPSDLLLRPLQFIKGVGPVRARLLARLNLETLQDLIFHFPVSHKDRASVTPIARIKAGSEINIVAQIIDVRGKNHGGREKVEACLQDESGQIRAGWWNPFVADRLTPNAWGFFSGKVTTPNNRIELSNAEFEVLSDSADDAEDRAGEGASAATGPSFGRIVPIYNLRPKQRLANGGEAAEIRINQNFLRKIVWQAFEARAAEGLQDQLPESMRKAFDLMPLAEAVHQFHFPNSFEKLECARRRLAFEELFIISLGVALRRQQVERLATPEKLPISSMIEKRIRARLPFTLTPAQENAFREISADLSGSHPMNRLLQGDVGCGKTAVAVSALLLCVAHGRQAALLAPTEVLAEQHSRTLHTMLANSKVKIGLLRGGLADARRNEFLAQLAAGETHIVVGTHALLESDVIFKSLALVVVDEQHKFGVAQRLKLRAKGRAPHVLVMTATPIPRTLTLTLYGDLDVSVIRESPPGRGEIVSRWVKETDREKVYRLITTEALKGHATYVVLPRIEEENVLNQDLNAESEKKVEKRKIKKVGLEFSGVKSGPEQTGRLWSEIKGVEEELKRLRIQLPELRMEMLHGRMSGGEKDRVLALLRDSKIDVLVSTQVIEVGIDLPTATVMVVENAELFGLAALHQLRGRVGRSQRKSYCLAFSQPVSDEARERIRTFVSTNNGFEIAEADFKLRGPGQFFGTQQSGMPELKIADLLRDVKILEESRRAAFELVRCDTTLGLPEHAGLKQRVAQVLGSRLGLVDVG